MTVPALMVCLCELLLPGTGRRARVSQISFDDYLDGQRLLVDRFGSREDGARPQPEGCASSQPSPVHSLPNVHLRLEPESSASEVDELQRLDELRRPDRKLGQLTGYRA